MVTLPRIASATVVSASALLALRGVPTQGGDAQSWTSTFRVEKPEFASTGRNPYFVLEPGYVLTLASADVRLTITVLNETRLVDGVETRVVEERETQNGKLVEVSRNYFAISTRSNSVFYFGEDVDMYANGKVTSHEGSWLAGVKGARFGLMVPGLPLLRARYYEETAPNVAMDRGEVVGVSDTLRTPAGTMKDCLRVEETTPLEPKSKEYKVYTPGIGLVADGDLRLVSYTGKP